MGPDHATASWTAIVAMAAADDARRWTAAAAAAAPVAVPLDQLITRPVVTGEEWLVASLAAQAARLTASTLIEFEGAAYVPALEHLRAIPRAVGGVELLDAQLAIVASIAYAPSRVVEVHSLTHGIARNALAVPVGVRPVVRLNFAPAGTGKTLMSIVSALAFVKAHLRAYEANDLWRADLFGCVAANLKPIAPLVVCIVSNAVHAQWVETATVCAAAYAADGFPTVAVLPKPGAATVNLATVASAVDAAKARGGAAIYIVSSALAQRALDGLAVRPTAIVLDEVAHDACNAKYVPVPFTLLVTASPSAIVRSLSGKRYDTILRTIFPSGCDAMARIAALDTARPYYEALVVQAATRMPPYIHFCEVAIQNRSTITLARTTDPCQHISRDELCRLMDVDPTNKLTLSDLLNAEGRDPRNRMGAFNMALFKRRFVENGQNECMVCRLEVRLDATGDAAAAAAVDEDDDFVLRAGNVIVTPCCSTMVCESCLGHLVEPKRCPQCSAQLRLLGLPLIFSVEPTVAAPPLPAPPPLPAAPPPPKDVPALLARVRAMPLQERPCTAVVRELLDHASEAGVKRAFVSWSCRDSMASRQLERDDGSREVRALLGAHSTEKPLAKRKLNEEMVTSFKAPKRADAKMSVLVANSTDTGSDQHVAGLNLVGTELVVAIGAYDRAQIIARSMRMGEASANQKPVIVVNVNLAPNAA